MNGISTSVISFRCSRNSGRPARTLSAILFLILALPFSLLSQATDYTWRPSSEGLFGANATVFGFAPNGNVLLGTSSGLFLLPAGEDRWQQTELKPKLQEIAVTQSGSILAAGELGTYRSTDNGMTWTTVFSGSGQTHFVPRPNDVIFATALGESFGPPSYYYKSTDDGVSWNTIWITDQKIGGNWILVNGRGELLMTTDTALLLSQNNGKTWELTSFREHVYHLLTPQPGLVVATTSSGTWRSTNDGTDWEKIDTFVPASFPDFQIASNGNYYYRVSDTASFHGLALTTIDRSTDGGRSRTPILERTGINTFGVAPDGTLWAGVDATVLRSTDNGGSWKRFDAGLSTAVINQIAYARSGDLFSVTPGSYYPLTAGGKLGYNILYRSSDNGATWRSSRDSINSFLSTPPYNRLFVSYDVVTWTKGGPISESRVERHVDISTDNGQSWRDVAQGDELAGYGFNTHGAIAFNFLQKLSSGEEGGRLVFTQDSGESWISLSDPGKAWAATSDGKPIRALAVLPDGEFLLSIYKKADTTFSEPELYRVSKDGVTATRLNDSLAFAALTVTSSGAVVGSGFFVTSDSVSGYGHALYRSTDKGTSWSPVGIFVDPHTYAFEPGDAGLVFAVSNDTATLRSTDNGETWKAISPPFVQNFVYHPSGSIFGINNLQVVYSVNGGKNWYAFSDGFPGKTALSLAITPGGDLFSGTRGYGVYRVEILSGVEEGATASTGESLSILESGSGEKTISFSVHSPTTVSLALYDLLGREVMPIFSGEIEAGTYRLPMKTSDLPGGTYVLAMKTDAGIISTKTQLP